MTDTWHKSYDRTLSMDDFILFDINESLDLYDHFNNNILDAADFNSFDTYSMHNLQQKPNDNRLILIENNLGSVHRNQGHSYSENSGTVRGTQASSTLAMERAEAFKEGLKFVRVDLEYNLRRWLEEGAEEGRWAAFRRGV
jgi:hypothetical protein